MPSIVARGWDILGVGDADILGMKLPWRTIPYLAGRLDEVPDDAFGVYVIWGPTKLDVVRVGQGDIRDRLKEHEADVRVGVHSPEFMSWATVSEARAGRVEAYLGRVLKPKVGDRFPDEPEIEVNLPWD